MNVSSFDKTSDFFFTDGAASMISEVGGLCGLLRTALGRPGSDDIMCHHCLAHRIELVHKELIYNPRTTKNDHLIHAP